MYTAPSAEANISKTIPQAEHNNIGELCDAIDVAIERAKEPQAPTCILMDTKKGAGIKSIEGDYTWHYGAIDDNLFEKFNKELEEDYNARCARAEKEGK